MSPSGLFLAFPRVIRSTSKDASNHACSLVVPMARWANQDRYFDLPNPSGRTDRRTSRRAGEVMNTERMVAADPTSLSSVNASNFFKKEDLQHLFLHLTQTIETTQQTVTKFVH